MATTMNRATWEQRRVTGIAKLGGDLWNTDQVWRKAFADPHVICASYSYIGTGLWVDLIVTLDDYRRVERRIYG